jgi:hypothetical protein
VGSRQRVPDGKCCGWKALKSICRQASPGSFDYAP